MRCVYKSVQSFTLQERVESQDLKVLSVQKEKHPSDDDDAEEAA